VPANRIARYNPTTNTWSALGSGTNNSVTALAVLPGGDVIVGGFFTTAGGVAASNIARYNPTTNTWAALGSGTNSDVFALTVLPGGDVIVGGNFTTAGGVSANRIARYNPTTNTWSALGSGTNSDVFALAVLPGGDVIAGGGFSTAGGVATNTIARYNPTTNTWSALGSGTNNPVYALAVLPGGDVIAGGNFLTAGGSVSAYFARYTFGAPAPTIDTQPVPQQVCPGGSAAFAVTGAGTGPFTYQWRKGGIAIDTVANPSAATAALTLTNVGAGDVASYDCVVSNACGSVTSGSATLTLAVCACNPADIANTDGEAPPDGVIDNGDFTAFFNFFFQSCP
jgi:uncharacterized protein (DUF849 family)